MSLVDVQSNDLLEKLIESLIGVCDEECPLPREVVIDIVDDLSCDISLAGAWWADNDCETRLCT